MFIEKQEYYNAEATCYLPAYLIYCIIFTVEKIILIRLIKFERRSIIGKIYTKNEIKMKLLPIFNDHAIEKAILFGSYARGKPFSFKNFLMISKLYLLVLLILVKLGN